MNLHARTSALRVLNRSLCAVQLRFYQENCLIWDAWLSAGAGLSIPDPEGSGIDIRAYFTDENTCVTHMAPARPPAKPGRLVAKMQARGDSYQFSLDDEAASTAEGIELYNQCAGNVRFEVRFLRSPFARTFELPSTRSTLLAATGMEVAALVNGVTTARVPINQWYSDLLIDTRTHQGNTSPTINLIVRRHRR
ncbi:hypothetical protein [Pseudomonas gingeri]|uniref:Uncharacterized protein n=1 Tax=Pseudomonas gingeri TaxID=117681 RepID=A0A7Y7YGZ3_9PSED|nr:hypothetical protein [Pseudomonas gingeri]NWA03618.1 hypothetical protein [Pseudomonas gingeri]NWA14476.1 hypothetical protein [Pseudomonas gingeri]NWA54906.1 hypothetical protein [Pseudomonas gingeri]NWA94630.1 hypothetical protein [Pseudomonas gingeri]NWB01286.1 hypothetical protein [Pseudomonas gingeri]